MKKKIFLSVLLSATALLALSACGDEKPADNGGSSSVVDNGGSQNQGGSEGGQSQQGGSEGQQGGQGQQGGEGQGQSSEGQGQAESTELATNKSAAIAKLDELINPVIAKITNDELKAAIQTYYDTEKQYINGITDVDTAKAALNKVVEDTKTFAVTTLKPLAVTKLNAIINPLITAIPNDTLKASVQTFYNTEMAKVDAIETLDDVATTYKEILDDTKDYIKTETEKVVIALKNKALEELDPYVTALIAKIPYDTLKTDTQAFYTEEKKLLEAVNTIEGVEPCVNKIKEDLEKYAIDEAKKLALAELDTYVTALINKITNETLKTDTQAFYTTEKAKLTAVTKVEDIPTVVAEIKTDLAGFALTEVKKLALAELDTYVTTLLGKITNETLKTDLQTFYTTEKTKLNNVTKVDDIPDCIDEIKSDLEGFAVTELKKLAIAELDTYVTTLLGKITNETLKTDLQTFYTTEKAKLENVKTVDGISPCVAEIKDDLADFAVSETIKLAVAALDPYVNALIDKIPYDTVKTDTQAEYAKEKKTLEAVTKLDDIPTCVEKIKKDLADFAVAETIKVAVAALDDVIDAGLAKLPNQTLKTDLENFEDTEIAKLEAVTKVEDVPTTLTTVLQETEAHIKSLLASVVKDYLSKLTKIETATAYDYLPEAMAPSYQANIITDASSINYDFTTFTNVSAIQKAGYGEQWQMVVENINQSITMAKVFNVAQTALNAAGEAVNAYIENSYAEEMKYEFSGDGYNGVFEFKDSTLVFNINITSSTTVPGVGTVKPVVKMAYDLSNGKKGMFISLGDSYKIKYLVSDTEYEMATTYGVSIAGVSGSRTSYLSVKKGKEITEGHIYEYTTIQDKTISACADFYVEYGYVHVVGNKASGMTGFDGYINELYLANEGRLLGYEVKETKTISFPIVGDITKEYNTFWFNLWNISGINSIKVTDKTDANESSRSTVDVYLNGSSTLFVPTYNTQKVVLKNVKTSRKYDIEYRSRFYYTKVDDELVVKEVLVPMMFIQYDNSTDSNYSDYHNNMLEDNGIDSNVTMNQIMLNQIIQANEQLVPIFISNKENVTVDTIKDYLKDHE